MPGSWTPFTKDAASTTQSISRGGAGFRANVKNSGSFVGHGFSHAVIVHYRTGFSRWLLRLRLLTQTLRPAGFGLARTNPAAEASATSRPKLALDQRNWRISRCRLDSPALDNQLLISYIMFILLLLEFDVLI